MLPPCKDVLIQKLARCNYVAYLWKHAHLRDPLINMQPTDHGWKEDNGVYYHSGLLAVICHMYFLRPWIQQMSQMGKMTMMIMMKITTIYITEDESEDDDDSDID